MPSSAEYMERKRNSKEMSCSSRPSSWQTQLCKEVSGISAKLVLYLAHSSVPGIYDWEDYSSR